MKEIQNEYMSRSIFRLYVCNDTRGGGGANTNKMIEANVKKTSMIVKLWYCNTNDLRRIVW